MSYRRSSENERVGFRWRTLLAGNEQQISNYSCWLEMENSSGLGLENDSGELQMENYSNGL